MNDVVTSVPGLLGVRDGGLQRARQAGLGQAADLVGLHRAGLPAGLLERDGSVEVMPQMPPLDVEPGAGDCYPADLLDHLRSGVDGSALRLDWVGRQRRRRDARGRRRLTIAGTCAAAKHVKRGRESTYEYED